MQIDNITLYRIAIPLNTPWKTAYGSDNVSDSLLVKICSGQYTGWGESCPLSEPTYSPEYSVGVFEVAKRFIIPVLSGKKIASPNEIVPLLKHLKGNQFAKAAFDMAAWDIAAQKAGMPLWKFIGGKNRCFQAGTDFGIEESIEILLRKIKKAVKQGYPRIKLKYGPGWELSMIRTVRKYFPDFPFHTDCNSSYTLKDMPMFRELDKLNLAMIEQPLSNDDLIDHAELQHTIKTPICLDESLNSPDKARNAVKIGAAKYFNLKPARLGGMTATLEVNTIAQAPRIPCWIGGMLESGVGRNFNVALGTLDTITYPSEIYPSGFTTDIISLPMNIDESGHITASDLPGSGTVINETELEHITVEKFNM